MKGSLRIFLGILAFLMLIVAPALANPVPLGWLCIDTTAPPLCHFKCVYNIQRNSIMLFGGQDSSGQLSQNLWEWSYRHWGILNYSGPSARIDFGMCYDKIRGNIILYGGKDSSGNFLGDTWIFSDTGWALLDIDGPSPRADFAMTYDEAHHCMILFGGRDNQTFFGETWEFDGSQWNLVSNQGPAPRIFTGMVSDSAAQTCVLFGGVSVDSTLPFDDTWKWDGANWTQVQSQYSPDARMGYMMASEYPYLGVILFGGQDAITPQRYFDDTWGSYISYEWEFINQGDPPARAFGDMTFSYGQGLLVLIGGRDGTRVFHDMWVFPIFSQNSYIPGDINGDSAVDGLDIIFFINYLKGRGSPPAFHGCPNELYYPQADVNGNCVANGIDITYLVGYLKGQHPSLLYCPDCPPSR